jgi:hypothetical protein
MHCAILPDWKAAIASAAMTSTEARTNGAIGRALNVLREATAS